MEYAYAAAYQLTGEARTGTNAYSIGYTYDAAGNRLTKVQNSVTESCAFGGDNQRLTARSKSYRLERQPQSHERDGGDRRRRARPVSGCVGRA